MDDTIYRFLIVDEMFTRYTVVVALLDMSTSIYCEECNQWVAEYDGDMLSQLSQDELYELIVETHTEQLCGKLVEFTESKDLSTWRE